jgi:hypothetical protein
MTTTGKTAPPVGPEHALAERLDRLEERMGRLLQRIDAYEEQKAREVSA